MGGGFWSIIRSWSGFGISLAVNLRMQIVVETGGLLVKFVDVSGKDLRRRSEVAFANCTYLNLTPISNPHRHCS